MTQQTRTEPGWLRAFQVFIGLFFLGVAGFLGYTFWEIKNAIIEQTALCVEARREAHEVAQGLRSPDGSPPREIPPGARPWSPDLQRRAYEACTGKAP